MIIDFGIANKLVGRTHETASVLSLQTKVLVLDPKAVCEQYVHKLYGYV